MNTIKLSEAIRQGSKVTSMGQHEFFTAIPGTTELATCALGAAAYAVAPECFVGGFASCEVDDHINQVLASNWPELIKLVINPVTGDKMCLETVIISLNDSCFHSRDEIADMVEELGY